MMLRPRRNVALLLCAAGLSLAGCNQITGRGDGDSAQTRMRNVEVQPGTASDEMVTLDQASGDGTAVDPSTLTAARPSTAPSASGDDDAADRPASSSSSSGGGSTATPAPAQPEPEPPVAPSDEGE